MLTSIDSRIIIVRRTLIMYYFIGNFNIFNLDSVWLYALARSKHIHKWQLFKLMLAEKISCHKRFKLSNCRRCERDLSRGHLKWWFSWGNLPFKKMPLIQGFEIYNSLHRYISNIYIYTYIETINLHLYFLCFTILLSWVLSWWISWISSNSYQKPRAASCRKPHPGGRFIHCWFTRQL